MLEHHRLQWRSTGSRKKKKEKRKQDNAKTIAHELRFIHCGLTAALHAVTKLLQLEPCSAESL